MRTTAIVFTFSIFLIAISNSYGQDTGPTWTRAAATASAPLELFHSNQGLNLPTAAMLSKEIFEFEIAHRFYPVIKDGHEVLFGLDGPANIRFALAYGISDRVSVGLGRSNLDDNLYLNVKLRGLEVRNPSMPILIGFQAGAGWNTQVRGLSSGDSRSFQYYVRVIANTMVADRLGLAVVPSYLYNTDVRAVNADDIVTLGILVQYWVSRSFSLLAEWDPAIAGDDYLNDPMAWGIELETGGHFFKLLASNSTRLNPSQYIAGSDDPAGGNYWHLGFSITRLLKFW